MLFYPLWFEESAALNGKGAQHRMRQGAEEQSANGDAGLARCSANDPVASISQETKNLSVA